MHRKLRVFAVPVVLLLATFYPYPQPPRTAQSEVYAPRVEPDRIVLTWSADPATTQTVTWRTSAAVAHAAAELAEADANPRTLRSSAVELEAATRTVYVPDHGLVHYHSVTFADLRPATLYAYRVGGAGRWSEWFHFRTASDEPEPFSFVYLGDTQNGIRALGSRVFRAAFAHEPDARFFLHAGDLVNRPNDDHQWGDWFAAAGWLNAMVPSVPVAGNHEYTEVEPGGRVMRKLRGNRLAEVWRPQFPVPSNGPAGLEGTVYYLDYQGARIVVLNSTVRRLHRRQARWLDEVLTANPHPWAIVAFHHPIHGIARDRDNPRLRAVWQPVLERHRVPLVLQGHDHAYVRSQASTGAPVYLISVAGSKMYEIEADHLPPGTASTATGQQMYQVVRVEPDRIEVEARLVTGELHDAFAIPGR